MPAHKENIIFPRYHQLDAVRRAEAHARRVLKNPCHERA
jgi:hypothetical protein